MKNVVNRALAAKSKTNAMPITGILKQENLVSQNYLDTNLKTYTRNCHLREGEGRLGVLTMVEEVEQFEFVEQTSERYPRNPKVWSGEYINIHRDKNGHYLVTLRKLEMNNRFNSVRVANAICTEFLTAQKVLGL